jgi:4-hydroxy-tetrahydrodipicolinate synthase
LVQRADMAEARAMYERIQILTRVVYRSPLAEMYTRMKEQLVMLNRLRVPVVRPPMPPIGADERRGLRTALVDAGLLAEPLVSATGSYR